MSSDTQPKLINLTPHAIHIQDARGSLIEIPVGGPAMRVTETYVDTGVRLPGFDITLYERKRSQVLVNTPDLTDGESTVYIVSEVCANAIESSRAIDAGYLQFHVFATPGELIRGEDGKIVGCRGLVMAAKRE